jgi:RNA 2',3'-cyclic 3'-phosphodiesterase
LNARLFVALELPAAVRGALAAFGAAAAERADGLRAVGEEGLHLTLAFLGHRPLDDVEPARAAVRGVESQALRLALGEPLWLGPRRPQVLTVALEDSDGALAALRADVVERLAAALDTVARVRRGARPRTHDLPEPPQATFAGETVVLYRSHLGGGPARYEALERVVLTSR